MGMLNEELTIIRGYDIVTAPDGSEIRQHQNEYYSYNLVIDSLITAFTLIAVKRWRFSNARDDFGHYTDPTMRTIENLKILTFGPDIRKAIADIVLQISTKAERPQYATYWEILGVHYGRELRDILYNFLIEFGAEEDFYYQTQPSDFLYSTSENGVTLVKYIGSEDFIDVLTSIDGIPVTEIGPECFKDCKYAAVKRVRMYDGLKTIN